MSEEKREPYVFDRDNYDEKTEAIFEIMCKTEGKNQMITYTALGATDNIISAFLNMFHNNEDARVILTEVINNISMSRMNDMMKSQEEGESKDTQADGSKPSKEDEGDSLTAN